MAVESSLGTRAGAVWVSAALFGVAILFLLDPLPFSSPASEPVEVPPWATDATPVRHPPLAPEYQAGVFTYRCSDCHRILAAAPESRGPFSRHGEIDLEHGINNRCLNCHHPTNRDAFLDDAGDEIAWDQPQQLCARCHGPVYRDWQHGAHGRTNGYWDTTRGPQTRRKCIECHDPHRPPFPSLEPAPGPHTLRMGPTRSATLGEQHDPLRLSPRSIFGRGEMEVH